MSLSDPMDCLARWIIEVQSFEFRVEYSPGDGTLLSVCDALRRDTISKDLTYSERCLASIDQKSVKEKVLAFEGTLSEASLRVRKGQGL